ncbi:MAG: hypothetical protein KIT11_10735 [Fimbriimonadaceae bacterium]|nr:hypothetical protein [Fimbriimonadaceae bacterium]QYK55796.1 MAG: hypothetical protein KF733_12405 [Fimbriimonadaceae bacterium]
MNPAAWLGEQRRIYFGNACSIREYRTWMRGNRAPILMGGYLGLLVLMALSFYSSLGFRGAASVSQLQNELLGFYFALVAMLEAMLALVAPVVVATSITGEFQRQSIDLVFSSPASIKYFLVGKLWSGFRYVLMLLALSFPIVSICIVMGGAELMDVLAVYGVLAARGLLYCSISVPIAFLAIKTVPTVIWSYLTVVAWSVFSTMVLAAFGGFAGMMGGSMPFHLALSPFLAVPAGPGATPVFGVPVPNVLLVLACVLAVTKLMMLGGGTIVTGAGSAEARSLRIHGAVYTLLIGVLLGFAGSGSVVGVGPASLSFAGNIQWVSFLFLIVAPHLFTWSAGGGPKVFPNGSFQPKLAFRGSPAGALPYLLVLLVCLIGGAVGTGIALGSSLRTEDLVALAGVCAMWLLLYSLGWAASAALFMGSRESRPAGPDAARRLTTLFLFLVLVMPWPVMGALESATALQGGVPGWTLRYYPLALTGPIQEVGIKALVMFGLAAALFAWADSVRRNAGARRQVL